MSEKILRTTVLRTLLVLYSMSMVIKMAAPVISKDYTDVPFLTKTWVSYKEESDHSMLYIGTFAAGKDSAKFSVDQVADTTDVNKLKLTLKVDGEFIHFHKVKCATKEGAKKVYDKLEAAKGGEDDKIKELDKEAKENFKDNKVESSPLKAEFKEIPGVDDNSNRKFQNKAKIEGQDISADVDKFEIEVNVKDTEKGKNSTVVTFELVFAKSDSANNKEVAITTKENLDKVFKALGIASPGSSSGKWYKSGWFIGIMIAVVLIIIIVIIVLVTRSNK